jgi:SAM-dependent methyltransferase
VASDDLARRRARQLAAEAAAAGDPAGWFETLYAEARDGAAVVPWDDRQANPHLTEWAPAAVARGVAGPGRRTLVVGCGICDDPVFLAGLGCEVTAFDVSPTAVAEARRRFAGSPVTFQVADLLALPPGWAGAFDLVAELYTVQALYGMAREAAIAALPGLWHPAARCW